MIFLFLGITAFIVLVGYLVCAYGRYKVGEPWRIPERWKVRLRKWYRGEPH